jgi:hypothetical protein
MGDPDLGCRPGRSVLRVLAVAVLVLASLGVLARPALAAPVTCRPDQQFCVIDVSTPGGAAGDQGATSAADTVTDRRCASRWSGLVVPCFDPELGWFNEQDACYWKLMDPQPPDDIVWGGHYPNGAIYSVSCVDPIPGTNGGWAWAATPPPGYGVVGVTPAQLAQRAVKQMQLAGPAINTSIPADRFGVVGVPVWLWTTTGPTTWGPTSATASVPGLSVTATATATQIVWATGDGRSETCRDPGTPHYPGGVISPTCQHIYDQPSGDQPNQAYTITATTTWHVTWTGGGASGDLTVTRASTGSVRIGEVQVLVTT